jgi:transcriptional regulator with XRE-family HTH domain
VATKERAADRGSRRGLDVITDLGREIRSNRRSLGLSLADVAAQVGTSASTLSRVERARVTGVSVVLLARLLAVVGLELSARAYPGGSPLRDARHAAILDRFRAALHRDLHWRTEVPLPIPGDKRAWDGSVSGQGWSYGVEAELNPLDGQAVSRRLQLKRRDGRMNGVIVLLPDTRSTRTFRRAFTTLLAEDFPVSGRRAMELLAAGADPGGSAIVVL